MAAPNKLDVAAAGAVLAGAAVLAAVEDGVPRLNKPGVEPGADVLVLGAAVVVLPPDRPENRLDAGAGADEAGVVFAGPPKRPPVLAAGAAVDDEGWEAGAVEVALENPNNGFDACGAAAVAVDDAALAPELAAPEVGVLPNKLVEAGFEPKSGVLELVVPEKREPAFGCDESPVFGAPKSPPDD